MRLEVSLLQWSDPDGGVRLVGRSADPDLVELVRGFLVDRLHEEEAAPARLRPIDGGKRESTAAEGPNPAECPPPGGAGS